MTRFLPAECAAHASEVSVYYEGVSVDNVHTFKVSSLSSSNTWTVRVVLSNKYNLLTMWLSPERLATENYVKVWSDDPFWQWGGCWYNATVGGYALYPFFIAPTTQGHDYGMSHTAYAVLSLISKRGSRAFTYKFSSRLRWNFNSYVEF